MEAEEIKLAGLRAELDNNKLNLCKYMQCKVAGRGFKQELLLGSLNIGFIR